MNVELTITDKDGKVICEKERYDFAELRSNPGFSNDERRCFLDLLAGGIGAVEWPRANSIFRVVRT